MQLKIASLLSCESLLRLRSTTSKKGGWVKANWEMSD